MRINDVDWNEVGALRREWLDIGLSTERLDKKAVQETCGEALKAFCGINNKMGQRVDSNRINIIGGNHFR